MTRRNRSLSVPRRLPDYVAYPQLGITDWDIARTLGSPDTRAARPRTRGECVNGDRPCPWISCRHHLLLDVSPDTGTIKLNFVLDALESMTDTCCLDVADRGGHSLEEAGNLLNVTRERARQIETRALVQLLSRRELAT